MASTRTPTQIQLEMNRNPDHGSVLSTWDLTVLTNELATVTDWYELGVKLRVPPHVLQTIAQDHPQDAKRCKSEMLVIWLQRTQNCSWKAVVDALRQMGMRALANQIQWKYVTTSAGASQEVAPTAPEIELTKKNVATMKQKFSELVRFTHQRLQKKLQAKEFDIKDFHLTVSNIFGNFIPKSSDLNDIFTAISDNKLWDYHDVHLLESVIGVYCKDDSEMEGKITAYKADLGSFKATTKIVHWMQIHSEELQEDSDSESELDTPPAKRAKLGTLARYDRKYFHKLEVKLNQRFTGNTLEYVDYLWTSLSNCCLLPRLPVLLDKIHHGCISISWLVQPHVVPQLIEKGRQCTEFFKKHEIIRVVVDGVCIYEEKSITEGEVQLAMTTKSEPKEETKQEQSCPKGAIPTVPMKSEPKEESKHEQSCPMGCGEHLDDQDLEHHLAKECPLQKIECDFCYAGCEAKLLRKDMEAHLTEKSLFHISLLAAQNQRLAMLTNELKKNMGFKIEELERENQESRRKMEGLESENQESRRKMEGLESENQESRRKMEGLESENQESRRTMEGLESENQESRRKMEGLESENQESRRKMEGLERENQALKDKFERETEALKETLVERDEELRKTQAQVTELQAVSKQETETIKQELTELKHNIDEDRASLDMLQTYSQFEFTMYDFEQHRRNDDEWYSPSFYTHAKGYKLCINVTANGFSRGKGTHVSVCAYLMRGGFDDSLPWPFQGQVTVQLLNQLDKEQNHREYVINFAKSSDLDVISRVTSGEKAKNGLGAGQFIRHVSLGYNPAKNCQYLKDNCIFFRVLTRVPYVSLAHLQVIESRILETESSVRVPPITLTLSNFDQQKRKNDSWYSPPFYSHPQGYRMCLNVYANGHGDGEGIHVSVSVRLMRGQYDDALNWPFRGDVTIQLLNQLKDSEHHTEIIYFTDQTPDTVAGRVTRGERGEGWGVDFIPHTELSKYLNNDCLCFHVAEVTGVNVRPPLLERHFLDLESSVRVPPITLSLTNFEQHKREDDTWYSPPFYTHPQGYRMCLNVEANGAGKGEGTHVSVFVYLMRGQHDNSLNWPFRGDITIQLLNQLEDSEHHTEIIHFTDQTPDTIAGRVTGGERGMGWGHHQFIHHTELNKYLKNDCLCFHVAEVTAVNVRPPLLERRILDLESSVRVPPITLTLLNFDQHKREDDSWYSPPFYTHSQGYRMCLSVNANGYGYIGKGTHVSVFICLMRGQYDNSLNWPFRGDITIQLLNQLEDSDHHTVIIAFTDQTPDTVAGRVTGGERGEEWGRPQFIPHSELDKYLRNDCLCFHMSQVQLKN